MPGYDQSAMWPTTAPEDITCSECRHVIPAGRPMLSELPDPTPQGMTYRDVANYCIGCPQCQSRGNHACYVRRLETRPVMGNTPRSLPCARCGIRIPAHHPAAAEIYYEWPSETEEGLHKPAPKISRASGVAVTASVASSTAEKFARPFVSFSDLTEKLQGKFHTAGMRGGKRTLSEAQEFYQRSVPDSVKAISSGGAPRPVRIDEGVQSVAEFIEDKDASHRLSVKNHPGEIANPRNVGWEDPSINRARGSQDMTREAWADIPRQTFLDTGATIVHQCLEVGVRSAFYAALLEAPVTAIENYILVRKGIKSEEQAVKDAADDIRRRAGGAAFAGAAVTLAVSVGAGPILAAVNPIAIPVGIVLYGYSALKRIIRALDNGAPVHYTGTYFCSTRCQQKFAWETGYSALMRWQERRYTQSAL